MALIEGPKEAIRLRIILQDIQVLQVTTSIMFFWRQSRKFTVSSQPNLSLLDKHVDVRHHFVREKV